MTNRSVLTPDALRALLAERILVLDDNEDILDIVQETLSYEQFEVKSTAEGNQRRGHRSAALESGDATGAHGSLGTVVWMAICQRVDQLQPCGFLGWRAWNFKG